jgi:endonuclease YncB( thermonuclease family)
MLRNGLSPSVGPPPKPFERLLPAGTEVLLVSEKLEKYGRTLGRILLRDGRDVSQEVLNAGLAKPYTGGPRTP